MVVALKPLHDAARIKHIVVSTYQATSGKGHAAVEELLAQIRALALGGPAARRKVFPGQIAFNVLCDWKAGEGDYSEEELKMVNETRKIMGDDSIGVSPTTVRVPVVNGHSEAVHVQFHRPMSADGGEALLRNAPGVVLMDERLRAGQAPAAHARRRAPTPSSSAASATTSRCRAPSTCGSWPTTCARARRSTRFRSPRA